MKQQNTKFVHDLYDDSFFWSDGTIGAGLMSFSFLNIVV